MVDDTLPCLALSLAELYQDTVESAIREFSQLEVVLAALEDLQPGGEVMF